MSEQRTRVPTNHVRLIIAEFIAHEVAGQPDHYVEPSPEMYVQADDLLGELHAAGYRIVREDSGVPPSWAAEWDNPADAVYDDEADQYDDHQRVPVTTEREQDGKGHTQAQEQHRGKH